jgi:uncharacterized protein (DUF924 family)
MESPSRAHEILFFWFGNPRDEEAYYEERRKLWFAADPQADQDIKNRFLSDYEQAVAGQLQQWRDTPHTMLALILLFDQFPRNMFRGNPQAFATDAQARALTRHLLQTGADVRLHPAERLFVYMPLMHSEDLAQQRQSVMLFRQLAQNDPHVNAVSYAERHLEIIERFGRFPHRNVILGRPSTQEELDFLQQPDSSF